MKTTLFALLALAACDPVGQAYSVRRAELELSLSCGDTGACDAIVIPPVPFERDGSAQFDISNPGARALTVQLAVDHDAFSVEPSTSSVSAGGSAQFTVSYAPSDVDDQETTLTIEHNAVGSMLALAVLGTTDADADGDGYRHELAPSGDDCNDFNASVNPGIEETWYDGIDQDCDGSSDYDQDGDGHDIHTRPDGDDCDDEDPYIHPDAPDPIDEEEIDSDCDGEDG